MKLRGNDIDLVEKEMLILEKEKNQLNEQEKIKWSDLINKPSLRRSLFIVVGVHIAFQFSGINAVLFYSTSVFQNVGLTDLWPMYATIMLEVGKISVAILSLFLVEISGRRILLIIGMAGM
jgi:hypothetical protein